MASKPERNVKVVADNRKARFNYEIGDVFEAGIALTCTGVHAPPRAVGIPRAANALATPRSDLTPLL